MNIAAAAIADNQEYYTELWRTDREDAIQPDQVLRRITDHHRVNFTIWRAMEPIQDNVDTKKLLDLRQQHDKLIGKLTKISNVLYLKLEMSQLIPNRLAASLTGYHYFLYKFIIRKTNMKYCR